MSWNGRTDGLSRDEQRRFWAEDAPFSLLQALENGSYDRGGWDAIIVDEAQDFFQEWWTILQTGLRDEGTLSVFFDARQSIFDHGSPVPTDHMAHFPLRTNFWNTKEICQVVAKLGDIDLRPHRDCPEGEAPTVYQQPGPSKTQRKVGELIELLADACGDKTCVPVDDDVAYFVPSDGAGVDTACDPDDTDWSDGPPLLQLQPPSVPAGSSSVPPASLPASGCCMPVSAPASGPVSPEP